MTRGVLTAVRRNASSSILVLMQCYQYACADAQSCRLIRLRTQKEAHQDAHMM